MTPSTYSAAIPTAIGERALAHLLRSDHQEDLCFAIWHPSQGRTRLSGLVTDLVLPRGGERRVHGNASFLPSYFERAVSEAVRAKGGLVLLHSHLGPGWQDMSFDDVRAEQGHAAAAKGATGLPLLGLTAGADGAWSARFWEKTAPRTYVRRWCASVRLVGDRLGLTFHDGLMPKPRLIEEWNRTVSAWGADMQADFTRLHIGIVGAGSVGAIIAEALARTGIGRITLIDFDTVEYVNLDRLLHATRLDAALHRSKVACLARALRKSATARPFTVHEIDRSVVEEDGFRAALDCDVLFSCVDRPWPRFALNLIAYAHLIPVVDGGIRIEVTRRGLLKCADIRAHVAAPGRPCLACLEQYDPGLVSVEREGLLDDPKYIDGLAATDPLRRNENVFAFSITAASLELLQMLMMVAAPLDVANPGAQFYHFVPGLLDKPRLAPCHQGCPYPKLIGRGDNSGFTATGLHKRAEDARAAREIARRHVQWRLRLCGRFLDTADALSLKLAQ
jgi:molybdopterin/thiamine biosynthesis adenylyltransferase